jgi:hypothetical protein
MKNSSNCNAAGDGWHFEVPFPFPKAMLTMKPICWANLQVLWDPNEHGHIDQQIHNNGAFVLLASGIIPAPLLQRATIPFNTVLL